MRMKILPALGPGALESVTLQLAKRPYQSGGFRLRARVTGRYTVYCGNGWDHGHQVELATDIAKLDEEWANALAAYNGDEDAAYELAGVMVNWTLEDWFDPCEIVEES